MRVLKISEMSQIYGTGGDSGSDGGGGDSGGVTCSATDGGFSCTGGPVTSDFSCKTESNDTISCTGSATLDSGQSVSGGVLCKAESDATISCTATASICKAEGECVTGSFTANTGQMVSCQTLGLGAGLMAMPTGFVAPAITATTFACNALANTQTGNGASFSVSGK